MVISIVWNHKGLNVVDVVCVVIKHYQVYMHHHATRVVKVVEAYHQTQGFNGDSF
jgi:hypothetical protein